MSILIKSGRVVRPGESFVGDILVEDETIAQVGVDLDLSADRVIDAHGKYVLPGAIDPHTHLDLPYAGTFTCDDFTSGTTAAAFGGTTTIVDFCFQTPGQSLHEALDEWHAKLDRAKPVIDVGFHIAVTDLADGGSVEELAEVPQRGVTSFKLFMAYKGSVMVDDATLFRTMEVAAETGSRVLVHAENGDVIEVLLEKARAEGKTEPRWHAPTRPPLVEAEATSRAIYLSELAECPLYVVHVSCSEAVEPIARARLRGSRVTGETCTQYLFIEESDLARPDFEGAKFVFTPPPRRKADHERLWSALSADELSVVSSDHAPYRWRDQKAAGRDDFTKIPNGAPGIEDRLQLLHHFGVGRGHLTLNRLVEIVSANPARLFGLYPRKGVIQVGSDADIVVFDPARRHTISAATHHSRVDYNMYEGYEIVGKPEVVLVRGTVVIDGEQLCVEPGHGRFVERARIGEELPAARTPSTATASRG